MRLSIFNRLAPAGIDINVLHHFVRRWSFGEAQVDSLIKHHHGDPLKWDDKQKVSYGYIENGGVFEWFFIDNDIRSFEAKLRLVKKYKLRGINNWFSGQDDARIWEGIREFSW